MVAADNSDVLNSAITFEETSNIDFGGSKRGSFVKNLKWASSAVLRANTDAGLETANGANLINSMRWKAVLDPKLFQEIFSKHVER